MKNILITIIIAIASTTLAYSLSPIVAVVNFSDGQNLSVSVTSGSGPAIYTENIDPIDPNSSGLLVFPVGVGSTDWTNIDESTVTTSHVLNVMDNGTVIAQLRLDGLIEASARSGLISSELRVKGNFSLNSEEFTDSEELGNITSNIMVYTGEGEDDFDFDDLNEGLPDNALYYIVNNGDGPIAFFDEDNFPFIPEGEFIILLKVDGEFFILNHDGRNGDRIIIDDNNS
ncbi:MAG: hypothetical protein ACE364_07655 [Chlorobiota bacterium]